MALTLKKLKDIWNTNKEHLDSFLPEDSPIVQRAETIFMTVGEMLGFHSNSEIFKTKTAMEDGIPTDNSFNVRQNVQAKIQEGCCYYFEGDGKRAFEIVWNRLAPVQNRNESFRVFSEAENESPRENMNTCPSTFNNRDDWFFSYNYPWHIIQWFQQQRNGIGEGEAERHFVDWEDNGDALQYKFLLKYLWMLSRPDEDAVVPILSLKSFYNLLPVFREIDECFDERFGLQPNHWAQRLKPEDENHAERFGENSGNSVGAFKDLWPEFSKKLLSKFRDAEADKKGFAKFLFYMSLADDAGVLDAETMLETGNHAIILYGPPGTGKTYTAKALATALLDGQDKQGTLYADKKRKEKIPACQIVQFHPNYTYQDFIEGIFPKVEGGQIAYELKDGIFKRLCRVAGNNPERKFVLIIDEINRADLSAVFGELMYCLEYRDEEVKLPCSGESFSIPKNVYLIGTMNNTDKSLIGFDLALRRRFGFLKLPPNLNVLSSLPLGEDGHYLRERAKALNEALSQKLGLSEDKQIGHAYFMKVTDFCDSEQPAEDASPAGEPEVSYVLTPYALEQLWDYHIAPLLEEYLGMEYEAKGSEISDMRKALCASFEKPNGQ